MGLKKSILVTDAICRNKKINEFAIFISFPFVSFEFCLLLSAEKLRI